MGAREPEDLVGQSADIHAAIKAGEAIERHRSTPKEVKDLLHGAAYVILRDKEGGERLEYVKEQFINPTFRKGVVKLDDGKSFIAYLAKHGTSNSAIYAKENPAKFVAVIDEHPATPPTLAAPEPPAWRGFRAEFTPALSAEWQTWKRFDRQPFESTEKFAYFLEDNLPDIIEPSGAELLEVALNFRVNQDVRFSAAQRLTDGHAEISFQNVVEGSSVGGSAGKIKIPEAFVIQVPVFAGVECRSYKVQARFRWRLKTEGLKLWYELVRPHKVLEQAFKDLWTEIGDGTHRTILLGSPE
jgi:uncharacterized protein YfdQ (DUF2303 family)